MVRTFKLGHAVLATTLVGIGCSIIHPHVARATSEAAHPHRIVVPLTDPARPATVHVGLLTGSITVSGWTGKEVVVDARPRDEEGGDEKGNDPGSSDEHDSNGDDRSKGLHRVPTLGSGLSIDEADNVVEIGSESWNQSVDLVLQVPAGCALDLKTVNDGDIMVRDVQGEINAENTNGDITIMGTVGSAVVHALNGEVVVRLGRVDPKKESSFSSLNGNIDVTLPADTHAELRVKADNGEVYTDFDVQWSTKSESREEEGDTPGKTKSSKRHKYGFTSTTSGVINGGGPALRFLTFNGNIYIRKAK